MLSGFLITTLALRDEERHDRMRILSFFIRRGFRILPLYFVALVCFLVADVFAFRSPAAAERWVAYWPYYLTMLQDIPLNLDWPGAPFGVSWSLGIEEKFYIAWPILGFVILSAARRLRATVALAAALAAMLLVWPRTDAARLLEWYLPILFGCIAAILLNSRDDAQGHGPWRRDRRRPPRAGLGSSPVWAIASS